MTKKRFWMVLEDEQSLRSMLSAMLTHWGVEPLLFADGHAAMRWINALEEKKSDETLPELFILDIRVPGPQGFEVGQQLRANPMTADIPIVMMTAYHVAPGERKKIDELIRPELFVRKPLPLYQELEVLLKSVVEDSSPPVAAKQPDEKKPSPKVAPSADPPPAGSGEKPVWLLLEDDYYIGKVLQMVTRSWGVDLTVKRSIRHAELWLAGQPESRSVELAIIDLNLPDGSGVNVARKLRMDYKDNPPKIILASGTKFTDEQRSLADLTLSKPLPDPDKLRVVLSRLVGRALDDEADVSS